MRCEVFKARAHRAGLSTARLARPKSAAENARARDSVRERTVREPHVTLAWSARAAVSTCACPASTSKTSEFDVCENSTSQTREKVELEAKPIQDHANRRDPSRKRICVSTQFTGSRGNLHRRLKVMGTFTAARSKATEPNLPLNDIIINTARRSPDRVFSRTLLASRREIRRMGAAALSAAPRFGVTRRRRASAPRTRNRELLVGGAPLQAAPRATRDLPPCRRRSQASRPRCRSTAGERL